MSTKPKVAVVTGSSRGLGVAIIRRLAQDGFHVVINYRSSRAAGEALAQETNSKYGRGRAIAVQADIASLDDVKRLAEVSLAFGTVTFLCLSAAIATGGEFSKITPEAYDDMFNTNVKGHLFLIQAIAPHMPFQSSIVSISSGATHMSDTPAGMLLYTASKGALEQITRSVAKEFGSKEIRINTVSPGPMMGDHYLEVADNEEKQRAMEESSPMKRVGKEEEVAAVVSFCAGPDSTWISGQEIRVNGGAYV